MTRFLTTMVLTVLGLIGFSLWWSEGQGARPLADLAARIPAPERPAASDEMLPERTPPEDVAARPKPLEASAPSAVEPPAPRAAEPRAPTPRTPEVLAPMPPPVPPPARSARTPAPRRAVPPVPGLPEPPEPVPAARPVPEPVHATLPAPEPVRTALPDDEPADAPLAEESVLPEPGEFLEPGTLPDDEPDEPERAVAMAMDPDESASLIRRLLDVYESLGSRSR